MKIFLALAVAALSAGAHAATLSISDWRNAGDGLLTVDAGTGLAWLDLTQTQGLTVAQVLTGEWASQGFRLATSTELLTLVDHGGASSQPFVTWLGGQMAPQELADYLGGPSTVLHGVVNPATDPGGVGLERFSLFQTVNTAWVPEPGTEPLPGGDGMEPGESAYTDTGSVARGPTLPIGPTLTYFFRVQHNWGGADPASTGVFLVRSVAAVPEPSGWGLMGVGLLAAGWAGRRSRRDAGLATKD